MGRPSLKRMGSVDAIEPCNGDGSVVTRIRRGDDRVHIALVGDADLRALPMLRGVFAGITDTEPDVVIVDLGGVDFVDCSILGILTAATARLALAGGRLQVTNAHGQVRRLLAVFPVLDTIDTPATRR